MQILIGALVIIVLAVTAVKYIGSYYQERRNNQKNDEAQNRQNRKIIPDTNPDEATDKSTIEYMDQCKVYRHDEEGLEG